MWGPKPCRSPVACNAGGGGGYYTSCALAYGAVRTHLHVSQLQHEHVRRLWRRQQRQSCGSAAAVLLSRRRQEQLLTRRRRRARAAICQAGQTGHQGTAHPGSNARQQLEQRRRVGAAAVAAAGQQRLPGGHWVRRPAAAVRRSVGTADGAEGAPARNHRLRVRRIRQHQAVWPAAVNAHQEQLGQAAGETQRGISRAVRRHRGRSSRWRRSADRRSLNVAVAAASGDGVSRISCARGRAVAAEVFSHKVIQPRGDSQGALIQQLRLAAHRAVER